MKKRTQARRFTVEETIRILEEALKRRRSRNGKASSSEMIAPHPLASSRRLSRGLLVTGVITLVVLPSARVASAQGPEVRELRNRVILGGHDVPLWQAFEREPVVRSWPGGGAIYRDSGDQSVTVVDQNGALVRRIGRGGEGPGEFQVVGDHGVVDDTLWVRNWPTPRISWFDSSGVHLRTERTSVSFYEESFSSPQGITGLLRDGYRYLTPAGIVVDGDLRSRLPVMVLAPGRPTPDTLFQVPGHDGLAVDGVGAFQMRPFPSPPLFAPRPDGAGLIVVDWDEGSPIRIRLFDNRGGIDAEHVVRIETAPVPSHLGEILVDSGVVLARGPYEAARRRGRPVPPDLRQAVRDGLMIPDRFPPVQDIFQGYLGRIWIRRMSGLGEGSWLVLSPEGTPLWEVSAPGGVRFQAASGAFVWGTWTDPELDVPYLGGFEVLAPGGA